MKSKNYFFYVLIFVFLSIFAITFHHFDKRNKKGTNLKFLSRKEFYSKSKNQPLWVYEQIAEDFSSIDKISQDSLDETYKKIKSNQSNRKAAFFRYRLINNKLYRFYIENEKISHKILDFERALLTLVKIIKLPNIDFIYSDLDGLPLDVVDEKFYYTKNQAPILCHAKIKNSKHLILIPDHNSLSRSWQNLYFEVIRENKNKSWDEKSDIAFWRGGTNDQEYTIDNFNKKPRIIISKLSKQYIDLLDAGITNAWFIRFEEILKKDNLIKNYATIKEHMNCKFLPIVDGNMCTYPGYQWRLLSNCLCFKQESTQVQWFYKALVPYQHFIPVENDFSDLVEKIIWSKKNLDKCKTIATNATDFALNNLFLEDIYVYLYKVLKSYSNHQNFDKKQMLKSIKQDSRWICIQNRKKAHKILKRRGFSIY